MVIVLSNSYTWTSGSHVCVLHLFWDVRVVGEAAAGRGGRLRTDAGWREEEEEGGGGVWVGIRVRCPKCYIVSVIIRMINI